VVENQLVSKKPPKSPPAKKRDRQGGLVELLYTKGYYHEIKIIKKIKNKELLKVQALAYYLGSF
jgi:hypothetical protein